MVVWSDGPSDGKPSKTICFLYENHQGSLTLTLPNALGVLGVLGVLNVLIVCLICPWTHRWPAEPCLRLFLHVYSCFFMSVFLRFEALRARKGYVVKCY